MNDWKYFFNHELNNPEQGNYRIFAPDYKAEILYWFSRNDIPEQQKEDFIRALINFDDSCGGFYRYRAYLLAAEAILTSCTTLNKPKETRFLARRTTKKSCFHENIPGF